MQSCLNQNGSTIVLFTTINERELFCLWQQSPLWIAPRARALWGEDQHGTVTNTSVMADWKIIAETNVNIAKFSHEIHRIFACIKLLIAISIQVIGIFSITAKCTSMSELYFGHFSHVWVSFFSPSLCCSLSSIIYEKWKMGPVKGLR